MPLFHARRAGFVAFRAAILLFSLCQTSREAAGTDKEDKKAFILCLRGEEKIGEEGYFWIIFLILIKLVSN